MRFVPCSRSESYQMGATKPNIQHSSVAYVSKAAARLPHSKGGTTPGAIERVRNRLILREIAVRRCAKECVSPSKHLDCRDVIGRKELTGRGVADHDAECHSPGLFQ